MKISSEKTETVAFKGKNVMRNKIVINGNIIGQVNVFRILEAKSHIKNK